MSPLAALVFIGFLFVIALCLAVWAALSLAAAPRRRDERERVAYVPLSRPAEAPVWRAERGASSARQPAAQASGRTPATAAGTVGGSATPSVGRATVTARVKGPAAPQADAPERRAGNDERRGAKAQVTQRPNLDDAFERFLEHERRER
ncbi:MAG TPA: hypothetical protein VF202_01410 [Trueperaceae bacterium]